MVGHTRSGGQSKQSEGKLWMDKNIDLINQIKRNIQILNEPYSHETVDRRVEADQRLFEAFQQIEAMGLSQDILRTAVLTGKENNLAIPNKDKTQYKKRYKTISLEALIAKYRAPGARKAIV